MLYVVMQTELNSREGAWERLCMERDPLVLSSLMWSWLEQLKDPVISREEVKALCEKNVNPQNALGSLRKVAGLNICSMPFFQTAFNTASSNTVKLVIMVLSVFSVF